MNLLWRPLGLAPMFALVLLLALLGANGISALLLANEGSEFDHAVRLEGDMARLISLLTALEHADAQTGAAILAASGTRFTSFALSPTPVAPKQSDTPTQIRNALTAALPNHEVRFLDGAEDGRADHRVLHMLSVKLNGGTLAGQWLNSRTRPLPPSMAWQWKIGFFLPLAASLVGTLLVGILFIRRMTAPLSDLARAARAVGRGNTSIRVAERGARELREAAAAFNSMQNAIAEFNAERKRLVAAIGHDLRTPITGLRIRAEMLAPEDGRDDMIRLLHEMTVMTNELTNYIMGVEDEESFTTLDLAQLMAAPCAERGVPLFADEAIPVTAQPVAIMRALLNLVDNALRYAGSACVRLSRTTAGTEVSVEDDGPGIPEALLGRVIEPFFRLEESRNANTGGLGLGIAIAKDIIDRHGGSIRLRNRPEGGLSVKIMLGQFPG